MTQDAIAIHKLTDVQQAYSNALSRLGLSNFDLEVDGERHSIDIITHPCVLLGRLSMQAEETSLLIFGQRIFPSICFIADNMTPTGMMVEDFTVLPERQAMDKNIQQAMQHPTADSEGMTVGHREIIIDASITDVLDVDQAQRVVRIKPHAFLIHNLFKQGERFENGQGLPLLSPDFSAINELLALLMDPASDIALNKAREKATELFKQYLHRKELADARREALNEIKLDA